MKFLIFVIFLLILSSCTAKYGQEELDTFAKCTKESGLKMYSSFTCSVCARQKALFGSSFKYVEEIECNPRGENPQTELCLEKQIEKTPTWILEKDGIEVQRAEGFLDFEALSEISGCSLKNG